MPSKNYQMLQETRKGLILAGEMKGFIAKEVTYKFGTKDMTYKFGTEGGVEFWQSRILAQNTFEEEGIMWVKAWQREGKVSPLLLFPPRKNAKKYRVHFLKCNSSM